MIVLTMNLPKTSLNVVYVEPQIIQDSKEREQQLTKFITLFAQVGFRELALNENFASELDRSASQVKFNISPGSAPTAVEEV